MDKGLQPVIRVRDKDNMIESLWQPMRFLDWIHRLRDHELEHSIKELQDSEDKWEPFEDSDIVPDSLYSSRISINMTPVKKQLNESLSQFSIDASFLDGSIADQTTESVIQKRRDDIQQCLIQMELAAKTLKGLCHQYESREVSGKVTQALDKVNVIMHHLKVTLEEKPATESHTEAEESSVSTPESTVIEKSSDSSVAVQPLATGKKYFFNAAAAAAAASPAKSNLRNTCPFLKNDKEAARSVRFNFK